MLSLRAKKVIISSSKIKKNRKSVKKNIKSLVNNKWQIRFFSSAANANIRTHFYICKY